MPSIEQTSRSFTTKVSRHERVRSIDYAIVNQSRKRITSAKSKARIELLSQFQRHPSIETVTR
jgi:hypothetical protein